MLLLGFAVPALLTDLECMVGRPSCNACSPDADQPAAVEDCSAASLAALDGSAPGAPPDRLPQRVEPRPAPRPVVVAAARVDRRRPRDGPPPLASGLRAPPA